MISRDHRRLRKGSGIRGVNKYARTGRYGAATVGDIEDNVVTSPSLRYDIFTAVLQSPPELESRHRPTHRKR